MLRALTGDCRFQSIRDYPHRLEEVVSVNRNKAGALFQGAESLFAVLAVVKSMTGLSYMHGYELEDANIHQSSKPSHTVVRIAPLIEEPLKR